MHPPDRLGDATDGAIDSGLDGDGPDDDYDRDDKSEGGDELDA